MICRAPDPVASPTIGPSSSEPESESESSAAAASAAAAALLISECERFFDADMVLVRSFASVTARGTFPVGDAAGDN